MHVMQHMMEHMANLELRVNQNDNRDGRGDIGSAVLVESLDPPEPNGSEP